MTDPNTQDVDAQRDLRSRRLTQISSLVVAALCFGLAVYAYNGLWNVVYALCAGLAMMVVCQWLNRRGQVEWGNMIMLVSLLAVFSVLMWISEGLKDVALLAYPMLLIMAGLLVSRRNFFVLLALMLGYMVFLSVATEAWHWRVDESSASTYDILRDSMLILLVSSISVWFVVNDLHGTMARLQAQIEKYRESDRHLTYISQHDILTGLPNRTLGRDLIEQAIAHAGRNRSRVAILFVDLDNFKTINDSLGHSAGDEYLQHIATSLNQAVRKSDIVARQGGDEFVIGLTDVNSERDVTAAAGTVMERLSAAFVAKDTEISASCSIGIAMYPDDGADYESLLRCADMAMYQAKESGRNTFRFFDEAMNASMQQSLQLLSSLRAALVRKEFVLHYQPVMDLEQRRLVGAEALVRWMHPDRGLVPPMEFIPAAEKSGLIVDLGEWVLGEACRQLMVWRAAGYTDIVMAVNLSPVQFRRGNVEQLVALALRDSGVPPACLELEITESTLIQDTEKFIGTLQKLKGLGVRLSIDDFGTGYSNLSYLQRFAVDKLKIDQSFVRRLMDGPQEKAIVSAIIQMAKSLHLATTAEGIEDDVVRQELLSMGCTLGQGYYFSRPVPSAEFAALMSAVQA